MIKKASLILILAYAPCAHSINTDNFVKKFCDVANVPTGTTSWLENLNKTDAIFPCYAGMQYAVPNKNFDGKKWTVNRAADVSPNDVVKAAVIYYGIPLAEEEPGKDVYRITLLKNGIEIPKEIELVSMGAEFNEFIYKLKKLAKNNRSNVQPYFPDGPLYNGFGRTLNVPSYSGFHQYTSIYGSTTNSSSKVNAIGLWGNASSIAEGSKVWGGFFTTSNKVGLDAQLVGVEIDVLNYAKPGIPPNASKVGLQVVTIGDSDSSAAIEILSDHKSRWRNGILFQDGAISSEGSAIAIANKDPIKFGIDTSQQSFTDSAILLKKNQRVTWRGQEEKPIFISSDDFDQGHFVVGGGYV